MSFNIQGVEIAPVWLLKINFHCNHNQISKWSGMH